MKVKCIDASNERGTGDGLLTIGKLYEVLGSLGGYYIIICDNGKEHIKLKCRFTRDLQ